MKKLIRNGLSHDFLTADGRWSTDMLLAREFKSEVQVIAAVRRLRLKRVELYCWCDPDERCHHDFAIPLMDGA